MTSIKSQLFYFTMRNRHLFQLRLKPKAWDWNTFIPEFRQRCERANARLANKLPAGLEKA